MYYELITIDIGFNMRKALVLKSNLTGYGPLHRTLRKQNAKDEIKKALSTFFNAPLENIFIILKDRLLTIKILEISSIDEIRYTLRISVNLIVSICRQHIFHPASEICCIFLNGRIEQHDELAIGGCAAEPIRQEPERSAVELEKTVIEPFVPIRQEPERSAVELEKPVMEPFVPIRQEPERSAVELEKTVIEPFVPIRQEPESSAVELEKPAMEPFVPIRQEQDLRSIQSSLRIDIPNGPSVSFGVNVNMVIYPHAAEPEDFQHSVSRCRINDERILNSPSKRQKVESQQEMVVVLPHADEITLEMLRKSSLETREISREILSFLEILRGGLIKFSRHTNPIQFMFNDFRVSYVSTTTLECIHWATDISYETYRRSVEFIAEINAFIKTIINQYL